VTDPQTSTAGFKQNTNRQYAALAPSQILPMTIQKTIQFTSGIATNIRITLNTRRPWLSLGAADTAVRGHDQDHTDKHPDIAAHQEQSIDRFAHVGLHPLA